jgi:DUF438 domain-containing protein
MAPANGVEDVTYSGSNPKYFFFYPSHRIFKRMHGALNVEKKLIA